MSLPSRTWRAYRTPQCPKCGYVYQGITEPDGPTLRTVTIDVAHDMTEEQFVEAARRNYRYMVETAPPAPPELSVRPVRRTGSLHPRWNGGQ